MFRTSWSHRDPSLIILMVPVVTYMAIVFSSYTNITLLILELEKRQLCPHDDDNCDENLVSSAAALTCSYIFLVESLFSIMVVGFLGTLSDHIGRIPVMCLSFVGIILENVGILAIMSTNLPVMWLCIPAALQGLCGSYSGFLCVSSAYVSDVYGRTSEDSRTQSFSHFEVMLSVGGMIGPVLGGWALSSFGFSTYFISCVCTSTILLVYIYSMPESLSIKRSDMWEGKWFLESTVGTLKLLTETRSYISADIIKTDTSDHTLHTTSGVRSSNNIVDFHPKFRLSLVSVAFFFTFGNTVSASGIYILFTSRVFGWGSFDVGIFLSTSAFVGVIALLFFRKCVNFCCFEISDISMAKLGALSSVSIILCLPFHLFAMYFLILCMS
jgi:MFS family permease